VAENVKNVKSGKDKEFTSEWVIESHNVRKSECCFRLYLLFTSSLYRIFLCLSLFLFIILQFMFRSDPAN
jgi:hypothetical protein